VGLNVRAHAFPGLETGHACLQELDPAASAPAVLHCVARPLLQALARFEHEGFGAFAAGFARRDLLCGRSVTTTHAEVPSGQALGVQGDGTLLLQDEAGRLHRVSAGEVSIRPRPATQEAA
jgi:BirA family biotin operon repressor/biotin-[acetyl-CoA-carboxylase] ligase